MEEEGPELWVLSWDELYWDIFDLGCKIRESYRPSMIVAVARGGWVVGRIISDLLSVDKVASIGVKFYEEVGKRGRKPEIVQPLSVSVEGEDVLVVDDVADTGETLALVRDSIESMGPSGVRVAVVYKKPWCRVRVDYYVRETNKWVVFPYEQRETIEYLLVKMERKNLERREVVEALAAMGFDRELVERLVAEMESVRKV